MEISNVAAKFDGWVDENAHHLFDESELIQHDLISIFIGWIN